MRVERRCPARRCRAGARPRLPRSGRIFRCSGRLESVDSATTSPNWPSGSEKFWVSTGGGVSLSWEPDASGRRSWSTVGSPSVVMMLWLSSTRTPPRSGKRWRGLRVRDISEFVAVANEEGVEIVILAIPVEAVPSVMEYVEEAGVRGSLNFAPTKLKVPGRVAVKNVNMVMELEALSFALSQEEAEG